MRARPPAWLLLVAAAAALSCARRVPSYSEACRDPTRPCSLSYDFEPSGAALDPFAPDSEQPRLLVANEDGLVFRWNLSPGRPFEHDQVQFAFSLAHVARKVESAASAVCDGVPVFLAATNFMPGRSGRDPARARVVAVVGAPDAPPRVLTTLSAEVDGIAAEHGAHFARLEGLALSPDCRVLWVGVRSLHFPSGSVRYTDFVHRFALAIDWRGEMEEVGSLEPRELGLGPGCSGQPEGISSLDMLEDGSLLVLTSFEEETRPRAKPEDVAEGRLGGSLWLAGDGRSPQRIACFPGHKPEAVVALPGGRSARVLLEDDDYGGRPIRAFAVGVELPERPALDSRAR